MKVLSLYGLKEVWMLTGQGEKKCFLPIHVLCQRLGKDMCQSLLKCHIGTGCDYLSKIGTKYNSLLAKPHNNLRSFGESGTLDLHQINEAESYLVNVYSKSTNLINCNQRSGKTPPQFLKYPQHHILSEKVTFVDGGFCIKDLVTCWMVNTTF